MREIKFRAWHVFAKQMSEVGQLEFFTDNSINVDGDIPVQDNNCILMQFIDRVDQYGVHIYEDDILELEDYGTRFRVVWDKARFRLRMKGGMTFDLKPKDKVRIIGNYYENPELLNHE